MNVARLVVVLDRFSMWRRLGHDDEVYPQDRLLPKWLLQPLASRGRWRSPTLATRQWHTLQSVPFETAIRLRKLYIKKYAQRYGYAR